MGQGALLQIHLMAGFVDNRWVLPSASAFSLLQYVVLVEGSGENLASRRCVVVKFLGTREDLDLESCWLTQLGRKIDGGPKDNMP